MTIDHRRVLEMAASGEWDAAHRRVQSESDRLSCLIHAHLHRIEGDAGNAAYWYRRAGAEVAHDSPEAERARLAAPGRGLKPRAAPKTGIRVAGRSIRP